MVGSPATREARTAAPGRAAARAQSRTMPSRRSPAPSGYGGHAGPRPCPSRPTALGRLGRRTEGAWVEIGLGPLITSCNVRAGEAGSLRHKTGLVPSHPPAGQDAHPGAAGTRPAVSNPAHPGHGHGAGEWHGPRHRAVVRGRGRSASCPVRVSAGCTGTARHGATAADPTPGGVGPSVGSEWVLLLLRVLSDLRPRMRLLFGAPDNFMQPPGTRRASKKK